MENKNFLLELSAEAEQDFDNSYNYYFSKSNDIANLFYNQINSALSSIKEYPYLYQKVFANIRKFTLTKFPFVIYYQIQKSKIQVIAVFHTSRNPQNWFERL